MEQNPGSKKGSVSDITQIYYGQGMRERERYRETDREIERQRK